MRITHFRELAHEPGMFNPETFAKEERIRSQSTYSQAYRTTIEELFSHKGPYPSIWTKDDSTVLCNSCAKDAYLKEREDITVNVYSEGSTLECEYCGESLPSKHGDPTEYEYFSDCGSDRGERIVENCPDATLEELFTIEAHSRQIAPFEFLAKEINQSTNPADNWEAFDEAISAAFNEAKRSTE